MDGCEGGCDGGEAGGGGDEDNPGCGVARDFDIRVVVTVIQSWG